jgi:nucleolar protein 53
MDPTEFGAGSAILEVSEAAKKSGRYDPWAENVKVAGPTDGFEPPKQPQIKVNPFAGSCCKLD